MPDITDGLDLPEEVLDALREHDMRGSDRLTALATSLVALRKEAVSARKESGIEQVWLKAEEAYVGIDDANRASFAGAQWAKPTNMQGPVTTGGTRVVDGEVKSDAYVRLTSRYVDAGAAKLQEICLPANEKAFSFSATPVPELAAKLKDESQAVHNGVPLDRAATPEDNVPANPDGTPARVPLKVKDFAQEALEQANAAAKKAETRIYDWMVESQFRAQMRKVIFDAARIGVGVLKGPFPRRVVGKRYNAQTEAVEIIFRTVPAYEWKDPWRIYPDPACGENIRDGDYLFEMDQFTRKQVRKLIGQPGYIKSAIEKVLEDGPQGVTEATKPGEKVNKHRFNVWYFHGTIKAEDLEAARLAAGSEPGAKKPEGDVYVLCTMVNDEIIRCVVNPLDSGEIPYHSMPWQRRAGHWAGIGVGEQIEMPQRAINAAIRTMFNNAGKSAGSIIVADQSSIIPADTNWSITPDKLFYKTPESTSDDVRKAFTFFQVPNVTPQMMTIIELCLKIAEESTNIPLVTQGQSGTTTPETYGATQLQNNNANQLLRSIGYSLDDYITEPVVNQSYEYLLLSPDVPDDEKGDWNIDAHGSAALVERAIEDATIQQMATFVSNPAFGINPKKWFAEFMKTKHLSPKNFQYTEEEQAKIDAQPKPAAPAVEAAKIRSQDAQAALASNEKLTQLQAQLEKAIADADASAKLQIAAMRKEVDEMRIKRDTDRDTVYVSAETRRTDNEYAARMRELEIKKELALLEYANKKDLKLDDVKRDLAKTQMTLQVQKELAGAAHAVDVHKHHNPSPEIPDAAEPPGKADNGKAFTQ